MMLNIKLYIHNISVIVVFILAGCAPQVSTPVQHLPTNSPPITLAQPKKTTLAVEQPTATLHSHWIGSIETGLDDIKKLEYSMDGQRLLAWGDGDVQVWEITKGGQSGQPAAVKQVDFSLPERVTALALSPDGQALAIASDNQDQAWQADIAVIALGENMGGYTINAAHTNSITALEFMANAQTLVSASMDGTLKFWWVSNGRLARSVVAHSDWITAMDVSPDGAYIATAAIAADPTVRLFDAGGTALGTVQSDNYQGAIISFSSDSQNLLVFSDAGWKVYTVPERKKVSFEFSPTAYYIFLPGGSTLTELGSPEAVLYDLRTGEVLGLFSLPCVGEHLTFAPDGASCASVTGTQVDFQITGLDPSPLPVIGSVSIPTSTPIP